LGTGVASAGDYPAEFSSDEGVAWKVDVPGRGFSTPIVWGAAIFLTSGVDGQDTVLSYDMDGNERWRKSLGREIEGEHRNGSGSNPSPVTDGSRLVAYFKSGSLACLDLDGNVQWQTNLQKKYGYDKETLWWDLGTSPVLVGDRVIVAVMHEGDSFLAAYDLANGEEAWKTDRTYARPKESDQAYTTPQLVELGGKKVIVTWGADHLTGHDAENGDQLWDFDGFNPEDKGMWRVIASATISDGYVVVPFGRAGFVSGLQLPVDPADAASARRWDITGVGADVPSPVAKDGKVILLGDSGAITCLDIASGDKLWTAQLPRNRNKYYASPVLAGDKLYCAREDGKVFVGRVGDEFELLAENDMGERIIATPAPVRGGLLIRGERRLFRVDGGGESTSPAG
jgi:outer membrane protein assembly factor BamB